MMEWKGIEESFPVNLVQKSEICSNHEPQLLFWKIRECLVIQKTAAKVLALDLGNFLGVHTKQYFHVINVALYTKRGIKCNTLQAIS